MLLKITVSLKPHVFTVTSVIFLVSTPLLLRVYSNHICTVTSLIYAFNVNAMPLSPFSYSLKAYTIPLMYTLCFQGMLLSLVYAHVYTTLISMYTSRLRCHLCRRFLCTRQHSIDSPGWLSLNRWRQGTLVAGKHWSPRRCRR